MQRSIFGLACASMCSAAALMATSVPAYAQQAEMRRDFNIPAQSLASALIEFSRQSGAVVTAPARLTRQKSAPALHGNYTPSEALRALLAGSGLRSRVGNGGSFIIERASIRDITAQNSESASGSQAASPEGLSAQQEIVVTGTNIRGLTERTSSVSVYDRQSIERSGYTSTQQFIRALPQNFSGGPLGGTEDGRVSGGASAQTNISNATTVNLHGLGAGSTLVLLNGSRIAPSAYGAAVDVSLIPLSAIERLEVLDDGSSAIYGSDAVGGVVNFVLRRDYEGAETRATVGLATDGGADEEILAQVLGTKWATGNIVGALQLRRRANLSSADRDFTQDAPQPTDLLPDNRQISGLVSGHQDIGDVRLSVNGLYTGQRNVYRYTDLFSSSTATSYTQLYSVNGRAEWSPFGDWRLFLGGLYSRERTRLTQDTDNAPFGYTSGDTYVRNVFSEYSIDAGADGTLLELPGGALKLAFGGSHRHDRLSSVIPWQTEDLGYPAPAPPFSRNIDSVYGELFVPLIGETNAVPAIHRLALTGALRYDRYSDFGGTTNPKIGVLWSPLEGLTFRSTYSTSYRAPNASESGMKNSTGLIVLGTSFSAPGGGTVPTFQLLGTNLSLTPETSHNFSAGVELSPRSISGLRLSANYYRIDYRNRLVVPPFDAAALLRPQIYGSLITAFSSDAEAQSYLTTLLDQGANFLDFSGNGSAGVRFAYAGQLQNAARALQDGIDIDAQYEFGPAESRFSTRVNAAIIRKIRTQFSANSVATDLVNTYGNPPRFRGRAEFGWAGRNLSLNAAANYVNSYQDTSIIPTGTARSWTTFDANVSWRPRFLSGLTLTLAATNIFDSDPPYVNGGGSALGGVHYDPGNASPLGRVISFEIRKVW